MEARYAEFNTELMRRDMAARGWVATDLARAARVSDKTVSLFLRRLRAHPPTAEKCARALGRPVRRYLAKATR